MPVLEPTAPAFGAFGAKAPAAAGQQPDAGPATPVRAAGALEAADAACAQQLERGRRMQIDLKEHGTYVVSYFDVRAAPGGRAATRCARCSRHTPAPTLRPPCSTQLLKKNDALPAKPRKRASVGRDAAGAGADAPKPDGEAPGAAPGGTQAAAAPKNTLMQLVSGAHAGVCSSILWRTMSPFGIRTPPLPQRVLLLVLLCT